MTPELHLQNEFRDWFALPFVVSPESHPTFSAYFGRQVSLLYLHLTLPTYVTHVRYVLSALSKFRISRLIV